MFFNIDITATSNSVLLFATPFIQYSFSYKTELYQLLMIVYYNSEQQNIYLIRNIMYTNSQKQLKKESIDITKG